MRASWANNLLLTIACCLAGRLSMAQRTAIAPLTHLPPVVRPVGPAEVLMQTGKATPSRPPVDTTAAQAARPFIPEPIYLLNSRVIISRGVLSDISPWDIAKIDVYKGDKIPVQLRSLTDRGVIDLTLKSKRPLKSKSLAGISKWLGLAGPVSFKLDGQPLASDAFPIATDAIAGLEVQRGAVETIVNIHLSLAKPTPPTNDPPGTIRIRIRGVAGR